MGRVRRREPSYPFVPPRELTALGRSLHALIDRALRIDEESPQLLSDLVDARRMLDELTERLAGHAAAGEGLRLGLEGESADARRYYVQGPLIGEHHPMAPPVEIGFEDGLTSGKVRFGVAFEGPPGCVHGGFVAWFFDQILGYHNLKVGIPGMTGTLGIRYRRPTPLDTDLRFEARTISARGRKVRTACEIRSGQDLIAESEGLFILPARSLHELRSRE